MNVRTGIAELRYSARHPLARTGVRVLLGAVVVMAVTLVYWWPAQHANAGLEAQITAKRRTLVETQQADELLRLYASAQKSVPLLEKKLEQSVSQAQLVDSLSRLARQHGVRVASETYEEGRSAGGQALLLAELTVQGSYGAVRNYLRDLPTLPMWTEVHEVRLEAARGSAAVRGRIRVATYRAPPVGRGEPS